MTKYDYLYIRDNNVPGWRQKWENLLNRFVVGNNELVEDKNAEIFRLGFTVAEVEKMVGHSGYTQQELEWYSSQPDRYDLIDGKYVDIDGWREEHALRVAEEDRQQKIAEIRAKYAAELNALAAPYTLQERETWPVQIAEAKAYVADNSATLILLPALAASRGIAVAEMAETVLSKTSAFSASAGSILARQKVELSAIE